MTPMIAFGITQLFRGARRGQALVAGFGAAVILLGMARRNAKGGDKLLFKRDLEPGEGMTLRFLRGTAT